jgi:hypothetical protein
MLPVLPAAATSLCLSEPQHLTSLGPRFRTSRTIKPNRHQAGVKQSVTLRQCVHRDVASGSICPWILTTYSIKPRCCRVPFFRKRKPRPRAALQLQPLAGLVQCPINLLTFTWPVAITADTPALSGECTPDLRRPPYVRDRGIFTHHPRKDN